LRFEPLAWDLYYYGAVLARALETANTQARWLRLGPQALGPSPITPSSQLQEDHAMRLRVPTIEFVPLGRRYAPRPPSLRGLRVGFLDGWGDQKAGTVVGMYPAMAEIERIFTRDHGIGDVVWRLKPSISSEVPRAMLEDFASRVDVVVNGEGL
jgi:hypothetical protein